jgi:heme a synthase
VMACPDFPLCHGRIMPPEMNFAEGFTLWRDLGMNRAGEPITFQALVAIHWSHRHFAWIVFVVVGLLAWKLARVAQTRALGRALLLVLALLFATGLSNVLLSWPLVLAVLHNGGAALLVALLVAVHYRLAPARQASSDSAFAAAVAR